MRDWKKRIILRIEAWGKEGREAQDFGPEGTAEAGERENEH